ncbi:MAG: cytochrome P460 family protein [Myxococcaceae bacterium]|nr:cytochrome P460 family protein [Myxococcaceae bacterium]
MNRKVMLVLGLCAVAVTAVAEDKAAAPEFPKDYRGWQYVKSMVIADKKHGLYGFHHVFVTGKGLKAFKEGKGYPEGTELVVPFYEVKEEGGAMVPGALMKTLLMKRDKKATDTGGWRFAAFDASDKPLEMDVKAGCFQCHTAKKDREFVFSEWADK